MVGLAELRRNLMNVPPPHGAKAPSPNGMWVSARGRLPLEFGSLIRAPGDESVRQCASLRRSRPRGAA